MGQTLSAPNFAAEADGWPSPAPENINLPSQIPPYNTTILDIGHLSQNIPCTWHVQGGHLRFPIPQGFRATCEIFGQNIHLSVEPSGTTCQFKLQQESGEVFTGATPTAPLAKWALAQGRLEIPNGLDAFGFTNAQVQAILRREAAKTIGKVDALVSQLEPGTAVGAWVRPEALDAGGTTPTSGGGGAAAARAGAIKPSLAEEIQREAQRIAAPQRALSLTPSLHNWLSVGAPETAAAAAAAAAPIKPSSSKGQKRPAPTTQITPTPPIMGEGIIHSPATSTPFSAPQIQASGLPPRPSSRAPGGAAPFAPVPSPEAHAAVLVNRPASRSRSGGLSSGRGWTAFTAFGLQTRDTIREANPWASATEIEKMVGRQWAQLTPEGKQHYADVAAEVRRSSQGNILGGMASGELRNIEMAAGLGVGALGGAESGGAGAAGGVSGGQQQNALLLVRTRSDAASEERQLRPTRRPKLYGPEYDTSDAPLPGRKGSVWESEIDRVYEDILAIEEAERVAAERAAAKATKDARAAQRRAAAAAGGATTKKEKVVEMEADVLGVLADMRAEVLASESAEAEGEEKSHEVEVMNDDEPAASEKMGVVKGITTTEGAAANGQDEVLSAHPGLGQEEQ